MTAEVYNHKTVAIQNIEIKLLLEAIYQQYGYDFRNYSPAHLKRRILHRMELSGLESISDLIKKVLWEREFFQELLDDLSINVTEMFRDPYFYQAFREKVVPALSSYPFIKIWHAGCSSGEEVYSLAILLREENLLNRTQIYATDFNRKVLDKAKEGIFSSSDMELYAKNYKASGGKIELADYYTAKYGSVLFDKSLVKKVVFADHNLVTDGVFAEVNLILCRNVLIYFDKKLQNRVVNLFSDSLVNRGFLCLGTKESLRFTDQEEEFSLVDSSGKIYQKNPIYQ